MKTAIATLLAATSLGIGSYVQAALHDFSLVVDQAQQIAASAEPPMPDKRGPVPGISRAFGGGLARYDDVTNTFLFIAVSGINMESFISQDGVAIHLGPVGKVGALALTVETLSATSGMGSMSPFSVFAANVGNPTPPPPFDPELRIFDDVEEAQLLLGNAYLNLATNFDPEGEVRGQFIKVAAVPEPGTCALMLAGLGLVSLAVARRKRR